MFFDLFEQLPLHLFLYSITLFLVLWKSSKWWYLKQQLKLQDEKNNNINNNTFVSSRLPHELFDPTWYARLQLGAWFATPHVEIPGLAHYSTQQFLPLVCHVCKRGRLTKTKLVRCSRCQIVRYCSKKHQVLDWIHHKPICDALVKVHAFTSMFRSLVKKNDPYSFQKYIEAGSVYLHCSKQIPGSMSLFSNVNAVSVWNRQVHCQICFTSEHLIHSCIKCHGVALCKECHATHATNSDGLLSNYHTEESCENWHLLTCVQGVASENGCMLSQDTKSAQDKIFVPKTWGDFFGRHPHITKERSAPHMCMVADGLSTPLTIVSGLCEAYGIEAIELMTKIVVHMVGASIYEVSSLERYCEISHCLPHLKMLKIIMVGPAISQEHCGLDIILNAATRCNVSIDVVSGSYENFASSMKNQIMRPTLVMAQHSGCEDLAWSDSWTLAIFKLCDMNVPCLFSGYVSSRVCLSAACTYVI